MIEVIRDPAGWKRTLKQLSASGRTIGFVPTMGALHEGHRSLLRRAKAANDITCASIFINPTQFNDKKDLSTYPKAWDEDRAVLEEEGADLLFCPETASMYPDEYAYRVTEERLSGKYCGAYRTGHFDGVLTVVMKLLILTCADRVYMGEKDWQQFVLIHRMAEAFFLDSEIIPCPTVREESGLAMSSRNRNLSAQQFQTASKLYEVLSSGVSVETMKDTLESYGFTVEYIERFSDLKLGERLLAAVYLGEIRLIDNIALEV